MIRAHSRPIAALACLIVTCGPAAAQPGQHAGDLFIGRTASNQLAVRNIPECRVLNVAFQSSPVFGPGWFASDPGWDAWRSDPVGDFYAMLPGADVWVQAVALDPNTQIVRFVSGTGVVRVDDPGDMLQLGDSGLHVHPFWYVSGVQASPPPGAIHALTLRLIDNNGVHSPSDAFVVKLSFAPPCDGDATGDRRVDQDDLDVGLFAFGSNALSGDYTPCADFDADGDVDQDDLDVILFNFGCSP